MSQDEWNALHLEHGDTVQAIADAVLAEGQRESRPSFHELLMLAVWRGYLLGRDGYAAEAAQRGPLA
jgi:hypothetical protein